MADLGSKIRYLRDCYRADIRGGGIYSLFDKKLDHLRFLSPRDRLLSSILDKLPMIGREVAETAKAASLYRREKSLLYMAFPVVGRPAEKGNLPAVLCAPLLVFPATLEARDGSSDTLDLRLDTGGGWLNTPAIAAFLGGDEPAGEGLDTLLDRVPEPPFAWEDLFDLVSLLQAIVPGLDASKLHQFPQLTGRKEVESQLRSARRCRDQHRLCLPACALGLAPNSLETRGSLYELDELAAAGAHSRPLRILLGEPPPDEALESSDSEIISPAVLSHAQQKVLRSAATSPLTVVIGPPGTGKTFTLAALALDHASRGESVLIAARRNQVLKVVELKIEELLRAPSFAVRAGRGQYLKKLKDRLRHLLQGGPAIPGPRAGVTEEVARDLVEIEDGVARLANQLRQRSGLEQRWGQGEQADAGGGLDGLFRSVSQKWIRWQLRRLPDHWRLLEDYEKALDQRALLTAELLRTTIRDRIDAIRTNRYRELADFLKGLRARHSSKQVELLDSVDLRALLGAFPLWLVAFADANRSLPHAPEIFDLVIVDEATQCDLATCLPIIDRGKRLVITGHPKQLHHVSFLSRSRQRLLAERHRLPESAGEDLDYRDKSLLDRAGEALWRHDQSVFLDEHFRSTPQIIEFSNRELYGGELRVMTRRPETVRRRSLELRRIDGRRGDGGANAEEARALVAELAAWTERERDLPREACHSLGVLSPFRDQVDLLARELQDRLGLPTIEKHDLLVGTPFAFQGEERDVMFLSLAVDAESHPGSFMFLNRADVFNVSITRARGFQYVFYSLDPALIPAPLVRKYLEEIERRSPDEPGEDRVRDAFLQEVVEALADRGYGVWPAYEVAGLVVDLVVERDRRTVGIDLIGHPGPYAESFDLERCRMLKRAGLAIFPLPYSAWHSDPVVCLRALDRFWQDRSA